MQHSRNQFQQFNLRLRLGPPVNALRISWIACLIRCCFLAVENVVGTQEHEPRADRSRRTSHVDGAIAIHCKRELCITLASIHIGIRRRQYDPFRTSVPYNLENTTSVANIGIAGAEARDGILVPFAHKRLPQQSGCTKESDSHGNLFESFGVGQCHATLVFCRHDWLAIDRPLDVNLTVVPGERAFVLGCVKVGCLVKYVCLLRQN